MKIGNLTILALLLLAGCGGEESGASNVETKITQEPTLSVKKEPGDTALRAAIADDYEANLKDLFEHFHANPELSFMEFETAKRMASEFKALGFSVTQEVGKTGVVGVMKNGEGPTVLLRADMDGLPVRELADLPYASKVVGKGRLGSEWPVMHACGHDTHMVGLIGAARQLVERKDQWSGTLLLIAQPAEEIGDGARKMLADGLYDRFPKPDYALTFHVKAGAPAGKIIIRDKAMFSSVDTVDIAVHGVGAHGASPHKGIDPVLIASQIVVSLQSVVSRTLPPQKAGVITVGAIHGGTKHNIIGERVDLQLTVRANDAETRSLLLESIERVANGVAVAHGVPADKLPDVVISTDEWTPPTINDTPTAQRVRNVFRAQFGDDILYERPREGMGGEDFANFILPETGVKGVYFRVGGTKKEELASAASHHSPYFKIEPRETITVAAEAMTVATLDLLSDE